MTNITPPYSYNVCNQGRRTGYSLRKSLEDQGVTLASAMDEHLNFVYETLKVNPSLDITRYRVNPDNPNGVQNNA